MSSEQRPIYEFAEFRLDPRARTLTRTTGERVSVRGKALDALIYLVEHAGEPVSRKALMQALWPTAIVEDNTLTQVVSTLRRALGEHHCITTISGRGYQFVSAVRAVGSTERDGPLPSRPSVHGKVLPTGREASKSRHGLVGLPAIAVLAAVTILACVWYVPHALEARRVLPRSVAVLPFETIGDNADDQALAAGPERVQTASLEAYAFYLQALASYRAAGGIGAGLTESSRALLHAYLDRAIELDERFAAAYAWKASLYADSLFFGAESNGDWRHRHAELAALIERNAARALDLDPRSALAYVARARLDLFRSRFADSRAALMRAQALQPNDSRVLQTMSLLHGLVGEFPAAIQTARRALEIDPLNVGSYAPLSVALQMSGQHAAAAAIPEKMIEAAPNAATGYLLLARAEAARGELAKALETLRLAERQHELSDIATVDLAASYRRAGADGDAIRLIDAVLGRVNEDALSPVTQAAVHLARGDDDNALRYARIAVASRDLGMDPLQLAAIEWNVWSLPALEEPRWRELRAAMARR